MEGKKRYIALVLFLLIGLTLFAFANPAEEQKGSENKGNGKDTTEVSDKNNDSDTDGTLETDGSNDSQNQVQVLNQQVDNTYANALAAVEKCEKALADELINVDSETIKKSLEEARELINSVTSDTSKVELAERADIVEESIDAIALVEALEELVNNAESKDAIIETIDYRTDNQVNEVVENLRNEDVKKVLEEILTELNLILDDETAPSYDGITNNETTKENVTLTVSDDTEVTVTVTLNGEEVTYTEGEAFTEEGVYEVVLVDEAFNETQITFTIDKTAPKFDGLTSGSHYETIEINVTDATETTITVKNMDTGETTTVENGTVLTADATYYITAEDAAGNQTSIEVTIDTTAPSITGVDEEKPTNKNEIVYVSDKFLMTVTIDGVEYTRDDFTVGNNGENFTFQKKITKEGTHTVVATDKYGNTTTKTFVIDKTAATAEITYSITELTNKNITVTLTASEEVELVNSGTWDPASGYATVFKKAYSKNTTQTVTLRDKAGNESTVEVKIENIDKTAPVIELVYSTTELTNSGVFVNLKSNEPIKELNGWRKISDTEYQKAYSTNYTQDVTVEDLAGNTTTVTVKIENIDKTAPEGEVTTSNKNGLQSTNQDVTATLKTNEAIVTPEGWTVVTEGTEFTKVYSENTKVTLEIVDLAGNKATVKFEVKRIDKVAPTITVVEPNKYQLEVHSEYVDKGYSAYDAVDKDVTNLVKIAYQFQAKGLNNWEVVDKLDTSKLGTYKITYTAYDKAGNTAKGTRVVEIVDTTAPLLTLNGEKTLTLEAGVDTYEELGATATDNYDETVENIQPEYIHYRDKDGNLEKVTTVDTTKVGTYKIVYTHTDTNGNVGVDASRADHNYVMRTVVIQDTTSPLLTLNGEKTLTLEAGIDTYEELGATATDNYDETITNIQPEYIHYRDKDGNLEKVTTVDTTRVGTYKIVYTHTDANGNVGVDASRADHEYVMRTVVVQDTINPTVTVKEESVGTEPYYSSISFSLSDSNKIDYFEINGTKFDRTDAKYSDANYQNIKSALVAGENTIVLYDTAGNKTEKTFYMDWTAPTVTAHSLIGTEPNYSGMSFKLSDNYLIDYFEVNGTKYDRSNSKYSDANYQNIKSSLVNGENTLVLYDVAGNSTTYTFTLERIAPSIIVKDSSIGINGLYSKLDLKLYDASGISSVVINDTQLPHTGTWVDINDGDAYTFKNGTNTITVTDLAGNVTTKTFNVTKFDLVVDNGVINIDSDVISIDESFYNVKENTTAVTINGNGKTVTQYVTSAEKFNWTESGSRPTMGIMFSSKNGSKLTINDLTFKGTVQSISLGHYLNYKVDGLPATYNFNTELNNVNIIGLNVVSYSAGISPAVVIYGTATLNNTNIYNTKLSELDTDPMWPVYDLAVVNYTNTTINGGHIGSIYAWKHAKLVIKAGSTVDSINVTLGTPATNIVVEEGATVGKIITSTGEMTFDEWQALNA